MSEWYNPSSDLIKQWAYDDTSFEPEQDWDIIIHDLPYENLYAQLASDNHCPKADYFLHLLYFTIGHSVRQGVTDETTKRVNHVTCATRSHSSVLLSLFRERVASLMKDPSSFSYDDWCGGALASTYT